MGGILEVAGIEGFLENLDDMMAASDSEGATWRSFVAAWWDRFGTTEVGTSDLYDLAIACEPPLPLGSGNERSQRTRLGKSLGRMRDRIFVIDDRSIRIEAGGTFRRAQRWRLNIDENLGNPGVNVVNVCERLNFNVHTDNALECKDKSRLCERCERFPRPYTCAGARAPVKETPEKRSQRSQRSQNPGNPGPSECERGGERSDQRSQRSPTDNPPDWLKDVL
jgi:putative DNA primase/helicase